MVQLGAQTPLLKRPLPDARAALHTSGVPTVELVPLPELEPLPDPELPPVEPPPPLLAVGSRASIETVLVQPETHRVPRGPLPASSS